MFVLTAEVFSQSIDAKAFTDKVEYEIGDYIYLTIEILHEDDLRVFKPLLSELVKEIEVISSSEPVVENVGNKRKIIYNFIVSKYDSADVNLAPIPVIYQIGSDTTSYEVFTNPIHFTVRTLPVVTASEIKDVKPPIKIPLDLITLIIILICILAIIALAVYFYKRKQRKKQKQVQKKKVYIIPAHVKAITELRALEEKHLWQQGYIKEYHTEITEIIRRYFEERFNILALESSTTEIMEQLTRVIVPENIYKIINGFLNNADLVKFAKFKPIPEVNEEMMRQAVDIVENTVPLQSAKSEFEGTNV